MSKEQSSVSDHVNEITSSTKKKLTKREQEKEDRETLYKVRAVISDAINKQRQEIIEKKRFN